MRYIIPVPSCVTRQHHGWGWGLGSSRALSKPIVTYYTVVAIYAGLCFLFTSALLWHTALSSLLLLLAVVVGDRWCYN